MLSHKYRKKKNSWEVCLKFNVVDSANGDKNGEIMHRPDIFIDS